MDFCCTQWLWKQIKHNVYILRWLSQDSWPLQTLPLGVIPVVCLKSFYPPLKPRSANCSFFSVCPFLWADFLLTFSRLPTTLTAYSTRAAPSFGALTRDPLVWLSWCLFCTFLHSRDQVLCFLPVLTKPETLMWLQAMYSQRGLKSRSRISFPPYSLGPATVLLSVDQVEVVRKGRGQTHAWWLSCYRRKRTRMFYIVLTFCTIG